MNKIEVIAPIVHAARVAYRQVHAPGKLLPEWGKTTDGQKREVYEVIRDAERGETKPPQDAEQFFLAAITFQCLRSLFAVSGAVTAPEASPTDVEPTPEPAPRRGRR